MDASAPSTAPHLAIAFKALRQLMMLTSDSGEGVFSGLPVYVWDGHVAQMAEYYSQAEAPFGGPKHHMPAFAFGLPCSEVFGFQAFRPLAAIDFINAIKTIDRAVASLPAEVMPVRSLHEAAIRLGQRPLTNEFPSDHAYRTRLSPPREGPDSIVWTNCWHLVTVAEWRALRQLVNYRFNESFEASVSDARSFDINRLPGASLVIRSLCYASWMDSVTLDKSYMPMVKRIDAEQRERRAYQALIERVDMQLRFAELELRRMSPVISLDLTLE